MELYNFFRSSASYRVRIALNLKGLDYRKTDIDLRTGEEYSPTYQAINPQGFVPALRLDDDTLLTQSLAIIEYLDEQYPEPALLARDPLLRAKQRAMALLIACDIHPLNNTRVLKYLQEDLALSVAQKDVWYGHWIREGFAALETMLQQQFPNTRYATSDTPSMVDVMLVPQVANANRFNVPIADFPRIVALNEACLALEAFKKAAPTAA